VKSRVIRFNIDGLKVRHTVSSEVTFYIARYGYIAIFVLVFLQELGVPNPVTNEFVLLFSGYLAFKGVLNLWLVALAAISADCFGTTILYVVFHRWGKYVMTHRPRWFPLSPAQLDRLRSTIERRQRWGIYAGRLIPFLRGYASVAAGLLFVRPEVFIPAVIVSAVTWSGGYVIAGRLLGPYWEQVAARIGWTESLVLLAVVIVAMTILGRAVFRARPSQ
jgi:membrane protein DedA with SNARE-associated domain